MFTILTTFGLLIFEIWILTSIALGLHYLSSRYGVSLLLMYSAAIVGIITFASPTTAFVEPVPGIILTLPADFFVPAILVVILVLYVVDGTEITQTVIFGIALIQLLVAFIFFMISLSVYLPNVTSSLPGLAYTDVYFVNVQIMFAGVIAFVADMFVIAIIYQGTHNLLSNRMDWLAVTLALVGAVWTDAIVFNFLGYIGQDGFIEFIPGDLISKSIGALAIAPLVTVYLHRLSPQLPKNSIPRYRPTFDIVHNLFGNWQLRIVQLESELRENEINAHQLITNINEVFWIADERDTHAFFISPAFDHLLGIPRGQFYLNPEHVRDIIHEEDRDTAFGRWLHFQVDTHDIEFRVVTSDGQIVWMRDRTYYVEDAHLGIKRTIGITENITAQKERQTLETEIAIEREKIQVLNELIGEVSHDIQSPISSLTLKIDLMERVKNDSKKRKKYLTDLKRQTFHLSQLLEHLFTLMKVESRSNQLLETADVNAICQDIVDEMLPIAEQKKLSLTLDMDDTPLLIQCTMTDIRRVFNNLIGNAIRYTPKYGTITVTVSSDDDGVQVSIQDTGLGIGEADLPHIFDRFYRAENTKSIDGTGLGLAITQQIIEQHHGRIAVESELDVGTRFVVHFPLADLR